MVRFQESGYVVALGVVILCFFAQDSHSMRATTRSCRFKGTVYNVDEYFLQEEPQKDQTVACNKYTCMENGKFHVTDECAICNNDPCCTCECDVTANFAVMMLQSCVALEVCPDGSQPVYQPDFCCPQCATS